jgi:chromate reductase
VAAQRRVLGVAGSLRRDSFNRRLLEHAATVAPDRLTLHVEPDIIRLPLFDEDLEVDGLPEDVQRVQALIRAADGVVLASPEYNFGVPGPVKNFVDWASRPPGGGAFVGKPVALIGASTGKVGGTVQSQGQLRVSLAVIGAHVLPWPPVLVAEAHTRFDDDALIDEPSEKVLRLALERFLELLDALAPREDG